MRYKQKRISSRVSDDVWEKLQKLKKDSGLTMTAIISKLIMGYDIKPLNTDELLRIYKELNHIGNNINQIATRANMDIYQRENFEGIRNELKIMNDNLYAIRRRK